MFHVTLEWGTVSGMEVTAVASIAVSSHCARNWKLVTGAVLGYELVSALTKSARKRGLVEREIPFLTEIIRSQPRPVRLAVTVGLALVFHDHFDSRKVFG